ncbi:MAG TPA: DUF1707 domain-containing protein [Solirubrobacteraceae bacterium]|nr:DUF1707 domain-containing protein [Solirubrobacteraceae bacterium]
MTNQYFLARISGNDPNIRASDADRERVAERLRKGHAEGRLDMTEFQDRLESCYEAKTLGQLRELVRDLPRPEIARQSRSRWLRPSTWVLPPLVPLLLALVVVAAASGHHASWLWIPFGFLVWKMFAWRRRRWWRDVRRGPDDWI